jgi:hypothetical protein
MVSRFEPRITIFRGTDARPDFAVPMIENIFGEFKEVEGKLGEVNIAAQKANIVAL